MKPLSLSERGFAETLLIDGPLRPVAKPIFRAARRNPRNAYGGRLPLDLVVWSWHREKMTIARISELERKTTQSGKANAGLWLLEFEREQPLLPDPLTGWNGSGDTKPQVRLTFPDKEAAIAYCDRHGLAYHIIPAPPPKLRLQAYADNFR